MARERVLPTSAYLVAYLLAVVLGRQLTLAGTGLALFWPAAGVAALWLLGSRDGRSLAADAALLAAATFVSNIALGVPTRAALSFAAANTVVGLAARLVWSRALGTPLDSRVRAVLSTPRDLAVAGLAALISAVSSMPFGLLGSRLLTGAWTESVALAWVVRNACGAFIVVVYALAVAASHQERRRDGLSFVDTLSSRRRPRAAWELVPTAVVTLAVAVLVFATRSQQPIAYLLVAAAAWIGFRFSPVVGASYTVVFALFAVVCTLDGRGPFGQVSDLSHRALILQSFIAVIAVISLMISLGTSERMELTRRVQDSEAVARDQADLLRAVTDVMDDGVLVIDSRGGVVVSNPAAQRLLPNMAPGVLRTPSEYGVHHLDGSPVLEDERPHRAALAGRTVPPLDLLAVDPTTGERRVISVSGLPLARTGAPDENLAVLLVRDVTRERAEVRELQTYAGVVAHDLKNPLASVMSWAEILDDQLDDLEVDASAARSSLVRLYRTADKMQQLITDLLAFTRTRSIDIEPEVVDLDDVAESVITDAEAGDQARRPRITHEHLGRVLADPTLVRQVVANLVGNAVKYVAEDTSARVHLSTRRVEDPAGGGGMVEVTIADNGLGIPAEDRSRIFDSFFRSSATSEIPGTGLGLAICASAVTRHGGTISARPGPGGAGTRMVFTLPADPDDTPPAAAAPSSTGVDGHEEVPGQRREGRTTGAEPPPLRTGSETAVG